MNRTVGVENGLTPVMEYLSEKGFQVEGINLNSEYTKNIDRYDAVIVTGMNKDYLGVQDIVSKIPVIEAKGMSAEQVYEQLNNSLSQ
jgi:galactitol-specific phosphotransferase system IIB component